MPSASKISRKADAILNSLEKNSSLTRDGRDWLIAALDPFHDQDLALAGYPDLTTASTVVQLVKQSFQITVPTTGTGAVSAGANWDCSVAMFPWMANQPANTITTVAPNGAFVTAASVTSNIQTGGITVAAGPQGAQLWPGNTVVTTASYTGFDARNYVKGNSRIIGMAFEIINTTADINKQGQVTAWRMPNVATDQQFIQTIATTPAANNTGTSSVNRFPPGNLADAQILYGSRSWAAREGAYVVARQNGMNNPLKQPSLMVNCSCATDFFTTNTTNMTLYAPSLAFGTNQLPDLATPFDLSGVHFTGLSNTTTLTINARWLFERMPGPQEPDLVVLATPSACYDPLALELYTHCLSSMPPGVMLSENPLGEWFASVIEKVRDWAPKIGNALGTVIPGAGLVGNALGAGAGLVRNVLPDSRSNNAANQNGPTLVPRPPAPPLPPRNPTAKRIVYKKPPRRIKKRQ